MYRSNYRERCPSGDLPDDFVKHKQMHLGTSQQNRWAHNLGTANSADIPPVMSTRLVHQKRLKEAARECPQVTGLPLSHKAGGCGRAGCGGSLFKTRVLCTQMQLCAREMHTCINHRATGSYTVQSGPYMSMSMYMYVYKPTLWEETLLLGAGPTGERSGPPPA